MIFVKAGEYVDIKNMGVACRPDTHAPIVCVRHPIVSRISHAFQIKYGATPHVQINCQTTLGHHSQPRLRFMSCSEMVAPWISVPGMPNEGWYFLTMSHMPTQSSV